MDDILLRQEETHEVEYELRLVIDGEVIRTVSDIELEVVTSANSENQIHDALNEFLLDEINSSEEDWKERGL